MDGKIMSTHSEGIVRLFAKIRCDDFILPEEDGGSARNINQGNKTKISPNLATNK